MTPESKRLNRRLHFWGAVVIVLPVVIVIVSGLLLQVKKQSDWIQPPTQKVGSQAPTLKYDELLKILQAEKLPQWSSWDDIDRLDVRPGKGIIKAIGHNRWEVQVNSVTGEVLQVAYRRSDLIESIHDGSFFHEQAKLWFFLPVAIVLLMLWITGIVMAVLSLKNKFKRRAR